MKNLGQDSPQRSEPHPAPSKNRSPRRFYYTSLFRLFEALTQVVNIVTTVLKVLNIVDTQCSGAIHQGNDMVIFTVNNNDKPLEQK
jgi:hypothetical protein